MTVQVLTDSTSCLPAELAGEAGVVVVPIHADGEGEERTTAGLSAMELTAHYARLLERSGDEGVVALHIAKGLSATWSNGTTAAGVVGDAVRVIDTESAGMVIGYAALAAGECAKNGGTVDEVETAAREALRTSRLWLYVHRIDALRKGGRLSTARSLFTSALAFKPIFEIAGGKLTLAVRSRTQAKAMDRLLNLVLEQVKNATVRVEPGEDPSAVPAPVMRVAVHYSDDPEAAAELLARIQVAVQELGETDRDGAEAPVSSDSTPRRPKEVKSGRHGGVEVEDAAKSAVREVVNEVAKSATTFLERVVASRAVQKLTAVAESGAAAHSTGDASAAQKAEEGKRPVAKAPSVEKSPKSAKSSKAAKSSKVAQPKPDATETLGAQHVVPKVELHLISLAEAVQIHTGPGAIAVSTVQLPAE